MQLKAVLFDFDGTLADSTALIMRCYRSRAALEAERSDWLLESVEEVLRVVEGTRVPS